MLRIFAAILIYSLAFAQPTRLPFRAGSAGGGSGLCAPTSEQLARRSSLDSLPAITTPALPVRSTPTCDPAYGSQITRVDDDSYNADQIDIKGATFFNVNDTQILTTVASGALRLYDVDANGIVSGGRTMGLVQTPSVQASCAPNNTWWDVSNHPDAPTSFYCAIGMRIYLVSTAETGTALQNSSMVADLTSEYPGGSIFQVMPAWSGTRVVFTVRDVSHSAAPWDGPMLAWYVVDVLSRTTTTPTTNYSIARKFKNGVDSANWYTFQTAGGLQLASAFASVETGTGTLGSGTGTYVNGYKPVIDLSGQWVIHPTNDQTGCTSPGTPNCGAHTQAAGPWNSVAIQNVATGEIRWAHGTGHSGAGDQIYSTFNGSGYGTCITKPKTYDILTLTTNPSFAAAENQGRCDVPGAPGFGFGIQYVSVVGTKAIHSLSCNTIGPCNTPVPAFQDELYTVSSAGVVRREVKLYHLRGAGLEFIQPIWNRAGTMAGFQSNWGSSNSYIFILKIID